MGKELLFVINTLSRAGAETALLELLHIISGIKDSAGNNKYNIDIYVLMGQGELAGKLPKGVRLLNKKYSHFSVLSGKGRHYMYRHIASQALWHGAIFKNFFYIISNFTDMLKSRHIWPDKLLWRVLADGAEFTEKEYDLAVSYIEGGSAYYTAEHVKAKKKAVFIHTDYKKAGYTRKLDNRCYEKFDIIFPISDEVKEQFLKVYPEYRNKTKVFHNIINQKRLRKLAGKPGGFNDGFDGIRLLTVGRLTYHKAYPVAIEAMRLLKKDGYNVRWYVLGEGPERQALEQRISDAGLKGEFVLCGAVDNPYPYYRQAGLYIHATRFEGKSIAIQEAQTLGCAIVASDNGSNREQIEDGTDGILCSLDAVSVKNAVEWLLDNPAKRHEFGKRATEKKITYENEITMLLALVEE
ncbi:MAG: glycosyltransferase [Lachnospiraceae bacterium]|nr:glycosyltransferase [Lachnospiraceae bacterium]